MHAWQVTFIPGHHIQDNIMASDRRNVEWNDSSKIWIWTRCVTNLNGFVEIVWVWWKMDTFGFSMSLKTCGAGSQSLNVSLNLQCRLRQEKVFYLPDIWEISFTDMWVSYVRRTWQSERDFSGVLSLLFFLPFLFLFCFYYNYQGLFYPKWSKNWSRSQQTEEFKLAVAVLPIPFHTHYLYVDDIICFIKSNDANLNVYKARSLGLPLFIAG